jgi:toxin ParE1/3/4
MERKIKNNYELSELAEEDLLSIFLTGMEKFGLKRAKQYYQAIDDIFNQLARLPNMGKSRDELFPGALSFSVSSHIVFYRKKSDRIEIARVLHKRMDYERHFNNPF